MLVSAIFVPKKKEKIMENNKIVEYIKSFFEVSGVIIGSIAAFLAVFLIFSVPIVLGIRIVIWICNLLF